MLLDFGVEFFSLAAADDLGADIAAALKQSHHSGLIFAACAGNTALTFALVHVPGFAADESLVCFNFAA